jgi:peptidoglycan biosynthesis protein MviN/MurJ (putative lipid II flippase)
VFSLLEESFVVEEQIRLPIGIFDIGIFDALMSSLLYKKHREDDGRTLQLTKAAIDRDPNLTMITMFPQQNYRN